MKEKVKARQYWAVRHNGENGDLILGRVKSVRTTGEVVLVNLLTGKISTKKIEVLLLRNKRIKKEQADVILDVYQRQGRPAARAEAVRMKSPYEPRQEQLPFGADSKKVEEADFIGRLMADAYNRADSNMLTLLNLMTKIDELAEELMLVRKVLTKLIKAAERKKRR